MIKGGFGLGMKVVNPLVSCLVNSEFCGWNWLTTLLVNLTNDVNGGLGP